MTLLGAILRKVRSKDSMAKKYTSPPPETDNTLFRKKKLKKKVNKVKYSRKYFKRFFFEPLVLFSLSNKHTLCIIGNCVLSFFFFL